MPRLLGVACVYISMTELKTALEDEPEEVAEQLTEKEEEILHNLHTKDQRMRSVVQEVSDSFAEMDEYRSAVDRLRNRHVDTYNGWNWIFIKQLKPEMYKNMFKEGRIGFEEIPTEMQDKIESELEEDEYRAHCFVNTI